MPSTQRKQAISIPRSTNCSPHTKLASAATGSCCASSSAPAIARSRPSQASAPHKGERMMHAFQNDPAVKAMYISRIKAHAAFDEIVQGTYWEEGPFRDQIQHGRGCAVGCTIHSSEHSRYETELGIPRQLAYLQDRIFE